MEKYIHELAKALTTQGHQVEIVAGAHEEGLPARDRYEGMPIYRFPARRSPLRCRGRLWQLRRLFTQANIISVSNTHMLEYYWRMFGPLADIRKVFLIRHGMSYVHPVPEPERWRARRSLLLAAAVVHDGRFIEKHLGVKPDLCPDQGLSPSADEMTSTPEPAPTSAVYIGRVEPDSGIRIYLDAVRRLTTEQGRDFRLHVYGDGSLMPELRDVVARESLPVIFHGRVLDAQRHITDSCFAFIDGRMAIQEAMARRRLVLAAYVDPLKYDYVAGEAFGPYLVPVASGAELAERVAHFIDHPHERAALVEKAYQHARTLTWNRAAETFVSFWKERLACSRPQLSWTTRLKLAWHLEQEAHSGLDPSRRKAWLKLGGAERTSEIGLPPRALSEIV